MRVAGGILTTIATAIAIAAVVTGGGGGGASWTTVSTANVAVSVTGNDSTCARSASLVAVSSLTPCATFDKAYQIASQGDTVAVYGGTYPCTSGAEGASGCGAAEVLMNADGTKTTTGVYVNFKCADSSHVDFGAFTDQFVIKANHVNFDGGGTGSNPGCFRFHRLWLGSGPTSNTVTDDKIQGSSMWMFDCPGCSNVTINNDQIGPDVACYSQSVSDGRQCHNIDSDNESYWFNANRANDQYVEPIVHSNGATAAGAVTITNNVFEKLNSRDINGVDGETLHTDCLTIDSNATTEISGNLFEDCMNIDLFVGGDNGGGSNITAENNMMGYVVNDVGTGTNFDSPSTNTPAIDFKCFPGTYTLSNILIRYNTIGNGVNLMSGCASVSYSNVRTIGNIIGEAASNGCSGNVEDYNLVVGGTCGTNTTNIASLPVISNSFPINYHLSGSPGSTTADNYVTPTTGDYALTTDFDGQTRNVPRDAGADDR